jgi:predicted ribosomally synthesized peptide with nif11-like leader
MSKQAWSTFKEKLGQDETLRSEMTRVLGAGGTKTTASVEELVAFAKGRGYEFSADDLRESSELGDQELSAVAGGVLAGPTVGYKEQVFSLESFSLNYAKIQFKY